MPLGGRTADVGRVTGLRHRVAGPARLLLDVSLAVFLVLLWTSGEVTLWLHLAYICVALCAFARPGARPTAIRATIVSVIGGAVLVRMHNAGTLPADDLLEIPLMSVLAYLFAAFAEQRTRAERLIVGNNEHLARLVDRIPLAIVAFDARGCVTTWNQRAEQLFGWSAAETIGKPNPIVPPGQRVASDDLFHRIRAGEAVHGFEVERCARDGTELDLALYSAPFGDASEVLVLYADIRERRRAERDRDEAERRFRELVESLPLVTYVDHVDDDATNIYTSPQIEQLLGWPVDLWKEDPRAFADMLHPDDKARVMAEVLRCNETGEPFEAEYRMRHRDGRYVWVRDHSSIDARTGKEPLARGFLLDITEQKLLEEQLLQSQKMDALGQLAGGIAHDFNNLLTGIGGYADLATGTTDDPLVIRSLQGIKTAAGEAASLTARLLAFSRRHVPVETVVDLNETVRSAGELLERVVRADVRVEVSLASGLPPVLGDPAQLKQVVLNLALNGRDSMSDGGVLTLETAHAGEARVVVRVRDTGCGMDDATRVRALEPFFTTKPEGEGTGLGLAVAYGVVDGMGGTLTLSSELGTGTVAEISLPSTELRAEGGPPAPAPGPAPGDARVLVVEDRGVVRELVTEVLLSAGFEVHTASGGTDALRLGKDHGPFDLLLTDVVMPGTSGPELAALLRDEQPDLPVLYMSGYTDDVLGPDELSSPNTSFVRKPFRNADLVRAVHATLAGQPWAASAFASASSSPSTHAA
jgi:PAS domain S-box-containing protein